MAEYGTFKFYNQIITAEGGKSENVENGKCGVKEDKISKIQDSKRSTNKENILKKAGSKLSLSGVSKILFCV